MSQSINLSTTATTVTKFNGTDVTKINLNGTEIWTKPSSASAYPTYTTSGASVSVSYTPYIQVVGDNGGYYEINVSTKQLYPMNGVGATVSMWLWSCGYGCGWVQSTRTIGPLITYANSPQYLHYVTGASSTSYLYKRSN